MSHTNEEGRIVQQYQNMVVGDKRMHLRPGDKQKVRVQGSPLGRCQSEKQSRRKRIVLGIFNKKLKESEME